MKVFLSLIGVLVVILVGIGIVAYQMQPADMYADAEHISTKDIYNDTEGVNYYYYYSENCSHCANIKDDVTSFYEYTLSNDDYDLYLIDTDINSDAIDSADENLTAGDEQDMVDYLNTLDTPKIIGTPTLIETTDGEITDVNVGETAIPEKLSTLY